MRLGSFIFLISSILSLFCSLSSAANSGLQKPPRLDQLAPDRKVTPNCPLPAFELAQYVKEGAQKTFAGAWTCGDLKSEELHKLDCGSYANVIGRVPQWGGVINTLGKDLFFQSLMANSAQRATCDANLIYTYATDQDKKNRLNAATETAFQKIRDELKNLTQKKSDLENYMTSIERDPRYLGDHGGFALLGDAKKSNQEEIEKINQQMTRLVLQVPMGHDPDVAQALIAMGSSGQFDSQKFYNAMIGAQKKYIDTAAYFQNKFVPLSSGQGQYCYGLDFMNMLGKTGEIDRWMQTSLPSKTREDKAVREKMQCYMKPYTIGQERLGTGMAIVGYATLFIPGAGEGVAATKALAGGFAALRAAGAVSLVLGLNSLRNTCFPPEVAMNSGNNAQCDPVAQMETIINRRPTAECAVGGTMALVGGAGLIASKVMKLAKVNPQLPSHMRPHLEDAHYMNDQYITTTENVLQVRRSGQFLTKQEAKDMLNRGPHTFRNRYRISSVFPKDVDADAILAEYNAGRFSKATSDSDRANVFQVDYKGNSYEVVVCKLKICDGEYGKVLKDQVMTVYPRCGPGIKTWVSMEKAISAIAAVEVPALSDLLVDSPCGGFKEQPSRQLTPRIVRQERRSEPRAPRTLTDSNDFTTFNGRRMPVYDAAKAHLRRGLNEQEVQAIRNAFRACPEHKVVCRKQVLSKCVTAVSAKDCNSLIDNGIFGVFN